jgi:porin
MLSNRLLKNGAVSLIVAGLGICAVRISISEGQTPSGNPALPSSPAVGNNRSPGQTGTASPPPSPSPAAPAGLFDRATLLGDMGGLRPFLGRYGIALGAAETSEVFGNPSGGVHRSADYNGLTELSLGLDTSKAFGLPGGTFNVSALQIHGRNLSSDNLYTLQTASGIEASSATRLWELWYQQAFAAGRIDVKVGQQSIDNEFITSQGSSLFINTAMGWPALPSLDLYAGGPAYPLSSPGVRVRGQPTDAVTVLGGVFDDNPPGGSFTDDSQTRGAEQSGTRFNTGTGALFIAEVQYAVNPAPAPVSGPPQTGAPPPSLPGTYKLGFYYDTGSFPDQRRDAGGVSLADSAGDGVPAMRHADFGIYGVMDQTVWRLAPDSARAAGIFARIMGGPGGRNPLDFSLNAGIAIKGLFHGRDNDTVGLGYGLARLSGAASALDQDSARFSGRTGPVRSSESFIELTYQAQIAPWWIVQPDAQYVFMPGGGIADPIRPGQRINNELVLGVRANVTF